MKLWLQSVSWLSFVPLCFCLVLTPAAAKSSAPDPALRNLLKKAISESSSFLDRFEAEVWLMDMSRRLTRFVPDTKERLEMLKLIHAEARRTNLDPELVLSVIDVESKFDRFAISVVGARGLMQVMPFWLDEIGREQDNLFHMATNLRMGCTILKYYLDLEKGDLSRALARYNGSLGRYQYPQKVFTARRLRWFRQ